MNGPTILIADDDNGIIRLLRMALAPLGAEIREANDAMAALVSMHKSPPDLVILDINMPSGNGLSVCEMISSDTRLSRIPVAILTGESSDRTRMRCQSMQAHYIQKGPDAVDQVKRFACRMLSFPEPEAAESHLYTG